MSCVCVDMHLSRSTVGVSLRANPSDDGRSLSILYREAATSARECSVMRAAENVTIVAHEDGVGVQLRCDTCSRCGCDWLERCLLRVNAAAEGCGCTLVTHLIETHSGDTIWKSTAHPAAGSVSVYGLNSCSVNDAGLLATM